MESATRTDVLVCSADDSPHGGEVVAFARALADRLDLRLRVLHGAGDPVERVLQTLNEDAALAVLGSRGRAPTSCPVIVVPPGAATEIGPEPTVVCGIDGSPGSDAAADHARALAHALGGRLMPVQVHPDPPTAPHTTLLMPEGRPAGGLTQLDMDAVVWGHIDSAGVAARLADIAAEEPSAIIVVGTRGHGRVRSAVFGSVSARLAAEAPVPVMIVPDPAHAAAARASTWMPERVRAS